MKKRMIIMLIGLGILFGSIFAYKMFMGLMIKRYISSHQPVPTVSTAKANYENWNSLMTATGSLRAIRGVNITTELAGMVQNISFVPGSFVKEGTVLVQLNIEQESAHLRSLQASAELAKTMYRRDKLQFSAGGVSKATLDNDAANLKSLEAQVLEQTAVIQKKTIRAPFTGRLGIRAVNLGQYVNPGDKIVSLQTLDPIYADFYLPQQELKQLKEGQSLTLTTDAFPETKFLGKITTIEPAVDASTRNVGVEATIDNHDGKLAPGMFASVVVDSGYQERYITLPSTAVTFNPYGEIVFIIQPKGTDEQGKPVFTVQQTFVKTGETRGDRVAILQGLKEGDVVVNGGQVKIKNGSQVFVDNSLQPGDQNKETEQ